MDDLTAHIQKLERCVDDNLLHESSYEDHWWRVLDFLELAGNAGIVVNPEKFQFGKETVDFAGFRISLFPNISSTLQIFRHQKTSQI